MTQTPQSMKETSTSSAVDSLASLSASQDAKKERQMTVTSGRTCFALLNKSNPLGSLAKMLLTSPKWHSFARRLTWKAKITDCNHLLFQLVPLAHKRDRLWLIAHAQSKRCDRRRENGHSQISKRQVCTDQQDHRQDIRSKTAPDAQLCSTSANSDGQRCCAGGDHWQEGSVLHDQDGDAKEGQCSGQRRQCRAGKAGATASDTDLKRVQGIRTQSLSGEQAFSWCQDIRGVEDYFNRPDIPQPLVC